MSYLFSCGVCCGLLSIWGSIQLFFMGICYHFEVVTLLEDVEEEEYEDYDDFIRKTTANYKKVAVNCWVASVIYVILIGVSYWCIRKAKKSMKIEALKLEDDEYVCTPKPPQRKKPSKVK
ncbi:ribonuclease kappa-A-like [Spodoptera litura]|uniref:Ribonuclease kappa-A-like n=1 Tax=Spodoptera litura TaxID=69820 RepID=A0A9J7DR28_SPOLT|nr:ribonuclease kappa-A-like [Spodoptera litura]